MTAIGRYLAPRTVEEAIEALATGKATALAGGTDVHLRWSKGMDDRPDVVVDLKRVEGLHGVSRANGEVRLGACTLLSELEEDPIIAATAPVLAEAARRVACCQIRNRATVGGNLCNASPAADTAVPLILLDAVLDLASLGRKGLQVREVPIADFFQGPGSTVLAPGEILIQIRFQVPPPGSFAAWDKFGTRPAMEIAVASVGVALQLESGAVARARVAYGSVAPVPWRGRKAEAELIGKRLCTEVIGNCVAAAVQEIAPITDVRASEAYRREVVGVMLRRMLERAGSD
ncbi:MAG: FAD binding domain-containing protein [Planctomycetota bacterium]|jgi:CO/xanthine dehydrogenase FAD-binding subunit